MKLALLSSILAILEILHPGGIGYTHRNSPTEQKYLLETMGGGVALLDYNQDGLLDVFFVNSGRLENPVKLPADFGRAEAAYWNRLYRQSSDGSFADVTTEAGLAGGANSYGMGAAVGDFDGDGWPDLYVTGYGRNTLYRNNGKGGFVDVTAAAGVGASGWSVSAVFLDFDRDGKLDLFVARYLDYELSRNLLCGTPFHTYCRPDKYGGTTNLLFRNLGGGHFADVSQSSGIAAVKGKGMGVAVNDYDGDGWPDVFVANDLMEQFLFHNRGDGTFEERAMQAGVALSDDGRPYSGMGAVFADYDNDGLPDIAVTNLALEKWALYRNEGEGQFAAAGLRSGLAGVTAPSSGWGAGLFDFDNDGWKDLFAARSHVLDNVERVDSALRYLEAPGLYRNAAGKFQRASLDALPALAGRGAAFGDLNNDGAMDVVVTALGGAPMLLYGRPSANHWMTLSLRGRGGNRQAIGARVRVGKQWGYVTTGGSYLSASDSRLHFGLGAADAAEVEILWPGGKRQVLPRVAGNRVMTVEEPE